ncbi:hypothetical protein ACE6ED_14795 [Paenibacillus sp. CN-4]|uniref:hypothetical protein n=1 Tax=Paenibacillus nanchangensis TaxID=3348343 RepID=UPI0039790185
MNRDEVYIQTTVMELIRKNAASPSTELTEPVQAADLNRSLTEWGVNSFRALYLLYDLEEAFRVQIPDNYLTPETFESPLTIINCLNALIQDGAVS